jgi:tripartite ATP-independent transporter DctM subunit
MATTMSCTGFAACTGDSVAAAATMGTVAYPSMGKRGYNPRLSTACIAAGGTLGILIPPSSVFIAYGFLTQTSIRELFIAGIIPGLVLSVMFLVQIYIMCRLNPRLGPPGVSFSFKERLISLRGVWGMLVLFLLIIGGLYFGIFTPTEAGAIGAAGAFLLALLKKRINRANLTEALLTSSRITCFIFTLVVGAMLFNTLMSVSGVQSLLSNWARSLQVSRYVILGGILLIYYVCGWFMDMLAVTFLTIPIFFPLISRLGFDPVWFGVLMCVLTELALITPPLALNLYVVQAVTKTSLRDIFLGIFPFVITISIFLIFLVLFPQICLFLPYSIG